MHPAQSFHCQQQRINRYQSCSDSYRFFNLLTSDVLLDKVEEFLPAHRERLYPPTETLSLFLTQTMSADRSCQQAVNQSVVQRLGGGMTAGSVRTGGYCRTRQRLPLEMVSGLTRHLGEQLHHSSPSQWHGLGRSVKLVDGTTVTMPDTPENQQAFPQQRGQQPGLGFPICRLVGITSLSSGAVLDAAIGRFNGKGGDEQTLLRRLEDNFVAGDVVLGDAFFATDFFIAAMQAKGVDVLMEQQGARRRTTNFRRGQKLAKRDHLITLTKPKIRPYWMAIVTTMACANTYSKNTLAALYKSRWQVELDIRSIKDTLGMNILSCKSPEMAVKEIWVYLLAYNLIRLMMAQSALLSDLSPRQISFKHCLQLWLIGAQQLDTSDDTQMTALFLLLAQQCVGKRPGRIEPRAVKRRPKAFPLLIKPRNQARAIIRQKGYPKKLK